MNLVNILTRRDPLKRAFVTLEDGMTDVLNEEFMLPAEPGPAAISNNQTDFYAVDIDRDFTGDDLDETSKDPGEDELERITAHTKSRLASYATFEEARTKASQDLGRISESLNNILATQSISREFLDDCFADIHRANDLETANAALSADNRRLNERADKLEKLRGRYDQLIDVLKRREGKLLQDVEQLRESLGTLKLEVMEARNHVTRSDALQGELQASLAAKTIESERFMRDAELLREKNVSLTLDLDLAQKRQADTRRKAEELSAVHSSDSARLAEISGRLAREEAEAARLQKLSDGLENKLVESNENAALLASELGERDKRYQAETHSLKMEVQSLNGRLHAATGEHRETMAELNDLRSKLSDVESEKLILEKKFSALGNEFENERRLFIAQGGVPLPQDTSSADRQKKQAEQLRSEIATLQETVKQLRQAEKAYTPTRMRPPAPIELGESNSRSNGKANPEFGRPASLARSA